MMRGILLATVARLIVNTASADVPWCKKLDDPETYKEMDGKYSDFRKLEQWEDGWVVRTKFDLKQRAGRWLMTEETLDYFRRFEQALNARGTELVVVMMPTRGQTMGKYKPDDSKYDVEEAQKNYLKMLNSMRAFLTVADMTDVDQVSNYFLPADNHWTVEGAKWSAQRAADVVTRKKIYKGLHKTTFSSKEEDFTGDE